MKSIVIAVAAVALVAGCAELPESVKHPFAATGATAQTDPPDAVSAKQASPYPYNSPYGN
jgi:uncharacterized lipoprotein YajG